MDKTIFGLIFILAGVSYGSLAIDDIYNHTIGYLIEHDWVKPPVLGKKSFPVVLGQKPTIILYALVLIIIGLFLLWNRNN